MRLTLFALAQEEEKTVDTFSDNSITNGEADSDDPQTASDGDPNQNEPTDPEKPLNVDLVYKQYELTQNDKQDTPEYEEISKLIQDRKDEFAENYPPENEIIPSESGDSLEGDDLGDGEDDDTPDDFNDEIVQTDVIDHDTEMTEHFSIAQSRLEYSKEAGYYTNDAEQIFNSKLSALGKAGYNAASTVTGAAGKGMGAVARTAGNGVIGAGKLVGKGATAAAPYAKDAAKYLASKVGKGLKASFNIAYKEVQRGSQGIVHHAQKYSYNFNKLEKMYQKTFSELKLYNDKKKDGYFKNTKLLDRLYMDNEKDLLKILSIQVLFYKEFSKETLGRIKYNSTAIENFVAVLSRSKDISDDYNIKLMEDKVPSIYKQTDKDYLEKNKLTDEYESKLTLMGNKKLVALLPAHGLDTYEDYLQSLAHSKVIIYTVPWSGVLKQDYLSKEDLIHIMNTAGKLIREMKEFDMILKQIYTYRSNLANAFRRMFTMKHLAYMVKTSPKTKLLVRKYVEDKGIYIDRCYIEPYLSINNMYYNDMKYLLKFVQSHLK